jgi:hypothetical protein
VDGTLKFGKSREVGINLNAIMEVGLKEIMSVDCSSLFAAILTKDRLYLVSDQIF